MDKTGFVKLPRSLLGEQWTKDPITLAVFVRLLAMANHERREWGGRTIPRGAAVISQRGLAAECGITPSQARTALGKLAQNGRAQLSTHQSAHREGGNHAHPNAQRITFVTISQYDSYNGTEGARRAPQRAPGNEQNAQDGAQKSALPREMYREIYNNIFPGDDSFFPILTDWIEYKKEMGKPYKGQKGITQFCNRLKELSAGDPVKARQIVNSAMAANYATIYAEKRTPTQPTAAGGRNPRIALDVRQNEEYKSTI